MDGPRSMESYRHRPRDPSPDLYNVQTQQTRGRNLGQSYRVNTNNLDSFYAHSNYQQPQQQYLERQPRRSRSADSRPQYNRGSTTTNTNGFFDSSSSPRHTSYREASDFSAAPSHGGESNRALSDVGVDNGGMDSFRFYQIPKYEAVVQDDSMLYSSSERRRYRGNSQEDFLVLGNKSPARAPPSPGQAAYNHNNNRDSRIDFVDRRHPTATRSATGNGHRHHHHQQQEPQQSLFEQERRYYNFAKENLITFGSCDEPTSSTGLSQEELLQRRQREEASNKRKEKRKTKNRIINFPSNLLKSNSNPQRNRYSQQNQPQSQTSTYHKMSTLASLESNSRGENGYDDDNDNTPNPNGYTSRGRGLRGSMVRRHKGKFKKSNNFKSEVWTEGGESNSNTNQMENDREMMNGNGIHEDTITPDNRPEFPKHATYSADHDYLLVQRDLDHSTPRVETTPRSKGSSTRPSYADFTPKSEYTPRDLFPSKHHPYTKEASPTSVMDAFGNSGGVRWNKNLTQHEVINTPQSTKLRPDSRLRNSSGKPKSILRSRYSSSYAPKVQSEERAISYPFDENPQRQSAGNRTHGFDENAENTVQPQGYSPDLMRAFVDDKGRDLSPIGIDRMGDTNAKFPESYVQFIEAVAAVVIQTKVRQRLAKNKVEKMRNQRHALRNTYRSSSEAQMSPMVRRSYALARKVRQANELKASKGRKDVALDFYALAAIQIQAAFRGWWVRDCLGVDNYCATMIQKTYRGSRCRNEYLMDLNRIVMAQSICRRWMAIDDAVTRIYCIVRIQAVMRGSLVRKRMMFDSLQTYHDAATKIQTLWRSFVCEMTFLRAYEDILVVQSIVRGWIARRRFRSLLQAKNNKHSQRRKPSARFKSSRLPSSKSRNVGPYSDHIEYMKKNLNPKSSRPEISVSQPPVVSKAMTTPSSRNRDSHLPWKSQYKLPNSNKDNHTTSQKSSRPEISVSEPPVSSKADTHKSGNRDPRLPWKAQYKLPNNNKGSHTIKKTTSNPGSDFLKKSTNNSEKVTLRTQPVRAYAGKTVSESRAEIERRRKDKEQEMKAQKEKENRRLESQNAGMAELELARKKMAWKATERMEEKLRKEEQDKAAKSTEESDKAHRYGGGKKNTNESNTEDSDYFAEVRKSLKKSSSVSTHSFQKGSVSAPNDSKVESSKVAVKKSEVVASGKDNSLVAKRREALMTSNADGPSTTKSSISPPKSSTKSRGKVDSKNEASPNSIPQSAVANTHQIQNADIPKRTLVTKSAYQIEMQKLRSGPEQKRIDYMHHIFEQAGVLSRVK